MRVNDKIVIARSLWGVILLPFCLLTLSAQTPTGSLRGLIQDSSRARIPSAIIRLELLDSALTRTVLSDPHGEFEAAHLPPGRWRMYVESAGFQPATSDVTVTVSSTRDVEVTLQPASSRQSINVTAKASSITEQSLDASSSVHQSIVSSDDLATLPLPARSFANIAYLAPGTEPVEPSDPTKARITAVSTGGSSGLNNELSVDGGDNSDDYIGGFLQNYSPDSIQEFAIRTSQEDADTGGTTAGSIVITTKSGTNQWHAMGAVYERAADLNARFPIENPTPNPKQPFSRQNYVGTLGGPVGKDKLWSFTAVEGVHEDASIAYSANSLSQFDALAQLAAEGLIPGVSSILVPSFVTIPFRDYFDSQRFDWAQSQRSHWLLRASTDSYTTHNDLVQQGTLPSTGLLTHNNYFSVVISNQFVFSPTLLGDLVLNASGLHLTQTRNSNLGFAYAFPFSSTALTISGFETFGDNQFATPITFFPSERNQEKYQLRYDVSKSFREHTFKLGANLIHEPDLGGAFPSNTETLYQLPQNPTYYISQPPGTFTADRIAGESTSNLGGGFSQNVQRLAFYAEDSWRLSHRFTMTYGLRYAATVALLNGSGRSQLANPGYLTLKALGISLLQGAPHDDRKQFAPRLGFVWSPNSKTVIRSGFGMYYNDLAQNGWATALQAVNSAPGPCTDPIQNPTGAENSGCIAGANSQGSANIIDPHYRTPYAIHISGGAQHAFNDRWSFSADYVHEEGNNAYRAYSYTGGVNLFTPELATNDPNQANYVPNVNLYRSDNRSSYNGLLLHLQANVNRKASFVANYTFSKAQTWGCVLGELFDYVNGVCDPLNAFGPGDYGPSGEDVRHRFVIAGSWQAPGGFQVSGLSQAESARPFTITTSDNRERISVNGSPTALDAFRGTPYLQTDLRVSRPFNLRDRWIIMPFAEFFNLFNRNNPGANYVTNVASLPVPTAQAQDGNVSDMCTNSVCTPITSLSQLAKPAGELGDFFGPGTTVGVPFAAQLGLRVSF
jgi:hypothetical protein